MRHSYGSDITREQFAHIACDLENVKKRTRPREVDLYEIFCAILYLLKSGCAWRNIPHDFPSWRNVRYYYEVWTKKEGGDQSVLDYVQAKLAEAARRKSGRNPLPSMIIIDSKTMQNADCAEQKGYDAGKKKQA